LFILAVYMYIHYGRVTGQGLCQPSAAVRLLPVITAGLHALSISMISVGLPGISRALAAEKQYLFGDRRG
jgi:hypothetical protein